MKKQERRSWEYHILDSQVLYKSVEEDVMLTVGAADFFIKNLKNTSPFHAETFYKARKLVLMYLREHYI